MVRSIPPAHARSGTYNAAFVAIEGDHAPKASMISDSLAIQVRSGSTATPGTGWTGWSTVSATIGSIVRSAGYLQYQVISTTSGTRFVSSATKGIQIGFHVP